MKQRHGLADLPSAIIATPLPAEDERNGHKTISPRFRHILWKAGAETSGDIKLLLIPVSQIFRSIKTGLTPRQAIIDCLGLDEEGVLCLFHKRKSGKLARTPS
jgi:hypothetical protein